MFSTYIEDYLHRRQRLPYPNDLHQDLNLADQALSTNDYWKYLFSKHCVANLKDMGFTTTFLYKVYEDLLLNTSIHPSDTNNTSNASNTNNTNKEETNSGRVDDEETSQPTKAQIADELKKIGLQTFFRNAPTERQLATLNALTDIADQRSIARKLHDLDVSTAELQAWLADEAFVRNFVERSHQAVEISKVQSVLSLAMRSSNGDHNSISLLDSLTSRFRQENSSLKQETLRAIKGKIAELLEPVIAENPDLLFKITDRDLQFALDSNATISSTSSRPSHPNPHSQPSPTYSGRVDDEQPLAI